LFYENDQPEDTQEVYGVKVAVEIISYIIDHISHWLINGRVDR